MQSGFIRGTAERAVLTPATLATPATFTLTLCPYDRSECRGRLMALSYMPQSSNTLVLGFRSMPFWEDLPVTSGGAVDARRARENLGGVSAVLGADPGGGRAVERTLLDFNTLYGTWPEALPGGALVCSTKLAFTDAALPLILSPPYITHAGGLIASLQRVQQNMARHRQPAAFRMTLQLGRVRVLQALTDTPEFSHLRPGYAWFDPGLKLLTIALAPEACAPVTTASTGGGGGTGDSAELLPVWNYTAPDFHGYHGEEPFFPRFERSDYSGYRELECLPLRFTAQATAPGHIGFDWLTLVATYDSDFAAAPGASTASLVAQRASLRVSLADAGADGGDPIVAAVWRDNANVTFLTSAAGAALPPLRPLRQTAAGAACVFNCWSAASVKVARASGAHGLANVRVTKSSILSGFAADVEYFSYTLGDVQRKRVTLTAPPPPVATLRGESAFGNKAGHTSAALRDLQGGGADVAATVTSSGEMPQWSVSMKIQVSNTKM